MEIRLTKHAQDYRLLRGISMVEIEDNLVTGIKQIDKLGIASRKNNLTIIYSKKEFSFIIKRLLLK